MKNSGDNKPSLSAALKLNCVLCNSGPLQKKGCWFHFRDECINCHFIYEREEGYFTGAAWIVGYLLLIVTNIAPAIFIIVKRPDISSFTVISVASIFIVITNAFLFPFSRSLWMYIDLCFNPPDK